MILHALRLARVAGLAALGCLIASACREREPTATQLGDSIATGASAQPLSAPEGSASRRDPIGIPTLRVPRLQSESSITVDGRFDEAVWAHAATTDAFVHAQSGKAIGSGSVGGSVRLLWDDEAMYLAFSVHDSDVVGGFPLGAIDPHLWTRDTVEVMVDPDGDGDNRDYYEIQVNPQNLVFDSLFDDYNRPRGGPSGPFGHQQWSAKLQSAVQIDGIIDAPGRDRGYTVEIKMRWSSFVRARRSPPRSGDSWRMNFYAMQRNGGSSWSPILGRGNFHKASRFGRVIWSE